MDQDDRIEIYTIPPNFAEEGTLFSGRIKTRNAVETAILLSVLLPILLSLELSVKAKMYLGMIVLVPMVILAVLGVQGESLFAFVASFFRFLGRRRVLLPPDERYRLTLNRKKEKAMRGGRKRRGKKQGREAEAAGMETDAEKNPKGMENTAKEGGCKIFCVYGNETFQIRIRYVVVFVGFCSRIFCRIYLSGYSISCPLSFIHAF